MRLLAGVAVVILALSPLAFAAARGRRRRGRGERPTATLVLEGLIVLATAVLGLLVAVALLED